MTRNRTPRGKEALSAAYQEYLQTQVIEFVREHKDANWIELRDEVCHHEGVLGLAISALIEAGTLRGPTEQQRGWRLEPYTLVVKMVKAA